MIKIIHIIPRLAVGGAERLLLDICRKLDKDQFDISVVALQDGNPLQESFEAAGIKVKFFHKKNKFDFKVIKRLTEYLREESPDIVHTHLFGADFWGGLAARKAEVKKIISTKHDVLGEGCLKNYLGRKARRQADLVIAISEATKRFLVEHEKVDSSKIKVIYNGVDVSRFYIKEPNLFATDTFKIGAVGRLSKEKGHKYLLRACRFLKKRNWQLILVGDGPLRSSLEAQARFLGIEDKVRFTGQIVDVRKYYDDFDVFVLPSISEGLSISLLEAALAGKFVLATNVGGVPEIVTDQETGLLFKSKNMESLLKSLEWVSDNKIKAQKMAVELQRKVLDKFDINKIIEQYESLYFELEKN